MADYYLILKRAIEREVDVDAAGRAALYDKARAALARQLDALDPPPAEEQVARVRGTLEDAVTRLEAEFGAPVEPVEESAPRLLSETPTPSPSIEAADAPPTTEPLALVTPAGAPLRQEPASEDGATKPPAFDDGAAEPSRARGLAQAAALVEGATRALSRKRSEVIAASPEGSTVEAETAPEPVEPHDEAEPSSAAAAEEPEPDVVGELAVEPEASEPAPAAPVRWPGRRASDRGAAGRPESRSAKTAPTGAAGKTNGKVSARRGAVPEALAKRQKGRSAWPVAAGLLALVVVIAGIGVWQRDALMAAVRSDGDTASVEMPDVEDERQAKNAERITAEGVTTPAEAAPSTPAPGAVATGGTGDAVRTVGDAPATPAPATATATVPETEPTETAALETPADTAPAAEPAPVGAADAVLFEERLLAQGQGDRFPGSVTWTAEQEPGADGAGQTILRGLVRIPERNLDVLLTLRRNDDETLPASHTIELLFETGDGFEPGGVANVMGILMKPTDETQLGTPLKGASARITDGYFLIGLSSLAQDEVANVALLQDEPRLEIPILYNNGQRAILELQKGTEGIAAFEQAFGAWAG